MNILLKSIALLALMLGVSTVAAQNFYLVRSFTEPSGMVGYKSADGEWVLPPCAQRLPLDSVYLVQGKDYRFVASLNGKTGVVDMKGNWLVEPKYQEVNLISPNRPYFQNGDFLTSAKALPSDHIQAVVAKGNQRRGIMYEMYLLDVETGTPYLEAPFYSIDMPYSRLVDVNTETKMIVLQTHHHIDGVSLDSLKVLDFDGKEITPSYYCVYPERNYMSNGKKVDIIPYYTCSVDGKPVIAYLKSKDDLDMVKRHNHKIPSGHVWNYSIVLKDIQGNVLPFKPLDKNWKASADYRFDPEPVAKALAKTKDAEPIYTRLDDAYSRYTLRRDELMAQKQAAPTKNASDWKVYATCTDSIFSIITDGNLYGIAANGAKVTVPCIYTQINEIDGYPGVFLLENEFGKGLSDGYSVTAPAGFKKFKILENGVLQLEASYNAFTYKEFADSTGMIFANNLEELLEKSFPDDADLKASNVWNFEEIGRQLGRRDMYPLAKLYLATKLENAGEYEQAYTEYETALYRDSRLTFAKERMDELKPIVDQIRSDREAAEKAERRARSEQIAAAFSQFAFALGNVVQAVGDTTSSHKPAAQPSQTVTRPSSSASAKTSGKPQTTVKPKTKSTPSATDVTHRNNQRKVYNSWENRLECMKNRWYPYSDGKYSQSDVTHAQEQMRQIRQLWESRGMWPYGISPMETWNGK